MKLPCLLCNATHSRQQLLVAGHRQRHHQSSVNKQFNIYNKQARITVYEINLTPRAELYYPLGNSRQPCLVPWQRQHLHQLFVKNHLKISTRPRNKEVKEYLKTRSRFYHRVNTYSVSIYSMALLKKDFFRLQSWTLKENCWIP